MWISNLSGAIGTCVTGWCSSNEARQTTTRRPRGRPRTFDLDDALDAAMRVFWRKGYLGTSLSDLTTAIGINRPSLYAAFGSKEALFRKALERYANGPTAYLRNALEEPTARRVVEHMLTGAARLATDPKNPQGCLVGECHPNRGSARPTHCRSNSPRAGWPAKLRLRRSLKRAVAEGDLADGTDVAALAQYVVTVSSGLSVQAAGGASRRELLRVVATVLRAWPAGPRDR